MKKSELILLTTALFISLFYGESVGLNLGILGISYALLLFFRTPKNLKTKTFLIIFVLTLLSSMAFAYYGDFISFVALFFSIGLLVFKSQTRNLKTVLAFPLFALNLITFLGRFFKFDQWLPKRNMTGSGQKFIAVIVIPLIFISIFFGIYAMGSSHFSSIFKDYEFDLNFWEFICLAALGFYLAFTIFNFRVYDFARKSNHELKNDFLNEDRDQKPTFSFMDTEAERRSGFISLLALNILLAIFIITFNYEQFVETTKTATQLSQETHERVKAVILSIVMAIIVIMFYFKGNFNFDEKAKSLKLLARIWICLNTVLVLSAFAKNSEYILTLGLTYKRLGVYAFLILAIIGLVITYLKIKYQKTNAFLFNHMIWYFYGAILGCSFINWGGLATAYNVKRGISDIEFLSTFRFNDRSLNQKFPDKFKIDYIEDYGTESFMSRTLYEKSLKIK